VAVKVRLSLPIPDLFDLPATWDVPIDHHHIILNAGFEPVCSGGGGNLSAKPISDVNNKPPVRLGF
jgi:hypothetical protein